MIHPTPSCVQIASSVALLSDGLPSETSLGSKSYENEGFDGQYVKRVGSRGFQTCQTMNKDNMISGVESDDSFTFGLKFCSGRKS